MIVYKITNTINDKVYIGVTKNTLQQRWNKHLHDCNYGSQNLLYRAMRKYGYVNFKIEEIDTSATTLQELANLERFYIKEYNSLDPDLGYNSIEGNYLGEYKTSGKSDITDSDVMFIRSKYNEGKLRCRECYNKYFKDKLSFSGFQKIWEGTSWQHIMPEVYTPENIELHKKQLGCKGETNGNSLLQDWQVLEVRKYYINHSRKECYEKYGKGIYKNEASFYRLLSKDTHKNIPHYNKKEKQWYLNNSIIDINMYNPVSTILGSEE